MIDRYRKLYLFLCVSLLALIIGGLSYAIMKTDKQQPTDVRTDMQNYWFVYHRKSNTEDFFFGVPGNKAKSRLVKTFRVKGGRPGERPTPLPQLLGRDYWIIVAKEPSFDNEETAPYFLTLDVPAPEEAPYGPAPYLECDGQCDWITPGYFGLHGINGDSTRLSEENPGSSGCIRHTDEDITFLYNIIDPSSHVRYYIEDN